MLKRLRKLCLALPETSEDRQFGHPIWRAGKKSFALACHERQRLTLCFWAGVDQQGLLIENPRYQIPPYMGHNGWIALDVEADCNWTEVAALTLQSYRHFVLKRMLRQCPNNL